MKIIINIPDNEISKKQNILTVDLHFIDGKVCECTYPFQELKQDMISVRPDENGYYPNVCGMCINAESELCDWCDTNSNFKKTNTKIPDFYKNITKNLEENK